MNQPEHRLEFLIRDLPSPESARRFFEQFVERNPSQMLKLKRSEGLLSDLLSLASYSPLLASTLIQNPDYVGWLAARRSETAGKRKEDLLESLARFELTHSTIEPHVMLARFRRRELLRIFLRDIRRLDTVAEITEELSDLADTILEYAARSARQEMDNRFGPPFETDAKGRRKPSEACIVSLGKLGSRELNYSSDIDLLFIYSAEGFTTGTGSRDQVTNREYFVKFAEAVTRLVGRQTGEGAAYRVDMRLRPHGRVGALALTLKETVRYYLTEARNWEQQVLIRSRASAGDAGLYRSFFSRVEETVFRKGRDVAEALREVYLSKERIDRELGSDAAYNVKLGRGGIREIEFIAQALQLAHAGGDRWLRVPHTLISIARLADRGHLTETERSLLSNAYDFLRRLEHILQMEHGLQTHSVPTDPDKGSLVAAKMGFSTLGEFESAMTEHSEGVRQTFLRVFGHSAEETITSGAFSPKERLVRKAADGEDEAASAAGTRLERQILASAEKDRGDIAVGDERFSIIQRFSKVTPHFSQLIASRPQLIEHLTDPDESAAEPDYAAAFADVRVRSDRADILKQLRSIWSRSILEIVAADVYQTLSIVEIRRRQTMLAEASISTAVRAAVQSVFPNVPEPPALIVFASGKLGSGTLDYGSDLDLIIAYDEMAAAESGTDRREICSRIVEVFVTLLSAMTRDGNLYRVDLRLRPHGKNGPNVTSLATLVEYIETEASLWELLAYVQMRQVMTDTNDRAEHQAAVRKAISRRAAREDIADVRRETLSMRLRLETTHKTRGRDIDIKFGAGGLLDIYFVVRCLVLSDPEGPAFQAWSTTARLDELKNSGLLAPAEYSALREGHKFLSELDHNLRLAFGRSSRFPRSNHPVIERVAGRMGLSSAKELVEHLAMHRIEVRAAFEKLLAN